MSVVVGQFRSPESVARLLGVRDAKVFSWIRTGELRASNLATVAGKKPRWKISPEQLAEFLAARESTPTVNRARRRKPEGVIQFFK